MKMAKYEVPTQNDHLTLVVSRCQRNSIQGLNLKTYLQRKCRNNCKYDKKLFWNLKINTFILQESKFQILRWSADLCDVSPEWSICHPEAIVGTLNEYADWSERLARHKLLAPVTAYTQPELG